MAPEKFPVSLDVEGQRATLRATGPHLETRDGEEFETACRKLLDTRQGELIVDLCPVETIQSMLIGEVAKTKVIATEDGRRFRLVTNRKVADIFKMILNDLVDVEVRD
ncbi:MAG: STAS domain-containing protein [Planctomycetota bacterium]|jgi:anti-anti-sigma regulatory factor